MCLISCSTSAPASVSAFIRFYLLFSWIVSFTFVFLSLFNDSIWILSHFNIIGININDMTGTHTHTRKSSSHNLRRFSWFSRFSIYDRENSHISLVSLSSLPFSFRSRMELWIWRNFRGKKFIKIIYFFAWTWNWLWYDLNLFVVQKNVHFNGVESYCRRMNALKPLACILEWVITNLQFRIFCSCIRNRSEYLMHLDGKRGKKNTEAEAEASRGAAPIGENRSNLTD